MKTPWIILDIGNTCVDICFHKENETSYIKIPSLDFTALDEFFNKVSPDTEIRISSVKKETEWHLTSLLTDLGLSFEFLSPSIMSEYAVNQGYDVRNLSYLGPDLFCDIVSEETDKDLIIVDLGTASKVLFLDKNKLFHGASILPGITTAFKSLGNTTSFIKEESLVKNPPIVSLKTNLCVSSGALYGTMYAVIGIIKDIISTYNVKDPHIILTGGNSLYLKEKLLKIDDYEIHYEKNSVLKGLGRIYGYNI